MQQETKQTQSNNHKVRSFTADERNAMRAYLQRSEVRLSTMHRVAVGFISGAGLLFLLPVFLKDGVLVVVRAIMDYIPAISGSGMEVSAAIAITYLCLIYPFIISLLIPAGALLLVIKDIVTFYFVAHPPGFPDELFNPRFILTGVAFSPDESEEVKARVLRHQYGTDLINFGISHADAQSRYYHDVIDKPRRMIVPRTRKLPRLIGMDVVHVPSHKPLEELADDDIVHVNGHYGHGDDEEDVLHALYVERKVREIDGFNAALGLAGVVDRALYEEVAKTEVSLVRHALKLRRLVLRYFQALLIFIWTSVIIFSMIPFLQDSQQHFSPLLVLAVAYFIWAAFAPYIVQLPLTWLADSSKADVRKRGVKLFNKSDAIVVFGRLTRRLCYVALCSSLLALALEITFKLV